jgi:uncharacterized protein YjbK
MKVPQAIRIHHLVNKTKVTMKVPQAIKVYHLVNKTKVTMKVPGVTGAKKMKIGIMVRVKAGEGTFLTTGRNG